MPDFSRKLRNRFQESQNTRPAWSKIDEFVNHIRQFPAPVNLVRFQKLTNAVASILEREGDKTQAVFYMGQALIVMPESYFDLPGLLRLESLVALVREMKEMFQHVDGDKFPKKKRKVKKAVVRPPPPCRRPNKTRPERPLWRESDSRMNFFGSEEKSGSLSSAESLISSRDESNL